MTKKETERETDRQVDGVTNRPTDKQTNGKRNRQTDNLLLFDEREEDDQWKHSQQILQKLSLDLDHLQKNECFPVI